MDVFFKSTTGSSYYTLGFFGITFLRILCVTCSLMYIYIYIYILRIKDTFLRQAVPL